MKFFFLFQLQRSLYWYNITNIKATLIFWHKARIREHCILDLKIHEVEKSKKYPDGVRYRLICKDLKSGRQVLMDNHHPKGHHVHLDDVETVYEYRGSDKLIEDFEKFMLKHLEVEL